MDNPSTAAAWMDGERRETVKGDGMRTGKTYGSSCCQPGRARMDGQQGRWESGMAPDERAADSNRAEGLL